MTLYRFTGNPFVDAGIAGMCAAARVASPDELGYESVRAAADLLVKIFTSPQSLENMPKSEGSKTHSAFATSEMSVFFPNGPLANPSNKPEDKARKYKEHIENLLASIMDLKEVATTCFVCGLPGNLVATKMSFPLIDSGDRRNFHPSHHPGHPVCARCALAVQFLPLSTMRTSPEGGFFWFLSSVDPQVAVAPAAELVLPKLNECISANKRLSLYGDWEYSGKTNAVVGALVAITARTRQLGLVEPKYAVTAFFFTNDNRDPQISAIAVPNSTFRFLSRLRLRQESFTRFTREALSVKGLSDEILSQRPIVRQCTISSENANTLPTLQGGWYAHALYMKEVLRMSDRYIKTVEQIALRIAESENPQKELKSIKTNKQPMHWLHQAIAKALLSRDELYVLVPPNNSGAASAALDYITAAATDAIRCKIENKEWEQWKEAGAAEREEHTHPVICLVEEVGDKIFGSNYDPKKLLKSLRKARSESEIRRTWLRAVEAGAICWIDFKKLVPPDNVHMTYTLRDYMLAYLFDRLRGSIEMEEIEEPEEVIEHTNDYGKEE